jgi:hypothetical protein
MLCPWPERGAVVERSVKIPGFALHNRFSW